MVALNTVLSLTQVSSHLKGLRGAGELFCLVSEYRECTEGENMAADSELLERIPTQTVTLCNSIGHHLDVRNDIKVRPHISTRRRCDTFCIPPTNHPFPKIEVGDVIDTAMCCTHFALAGADAIYVWQYKPPKVCCTHKQHDRSLNAAVAAASYSDMKNNSI